MGVVLFMKDINWAVIGVGFIANEMANALIKDNRNIYSVANRTQKKAIDFANKYNIKKVYDNIDDVFTDSNVDAIYIATPHNTHLNFIKKAIENNKHVLVEKSITLNSDELNEVIELAKKRMLLLQKQ